MPVRYRDSQDEPVLATERAVSDPLARPTRCDEGLKPESSVVYGDLPLGITPSSNDSAGR
ncbi:hypothetical protein [Sinorhizobium meliloti]|uniref:hypothetical protein n=1 Tax=Rhizobium meliloti TaxID=382 RepID=UPI0013E38A31|nr:hypothetical protein [Sinorhizobium meliloti]